MYRTVVIISFILAFQSCNKSWKFENSCNKTTLEIKKSKSFLLYNHFFENNFPRILSLIIDSEKELDISKEIEIIWIFFERENKGIGVIKIKEIAYSILKDNNEMTITKGVSDNFFSTLDKENFADFSNGLDLELLQLTDTGSGFYVLINGGLKNIIPINN